MDWVSPLAFAGLGSGEKKSLMISKKTFIVCCLGLFLSACSAGGGAKQPVSSDVAIGLTALNKGVELYQKGCSEQALELFLKAHERMTACDHVPGVAMSLNNIGNVYRRIGDPGSALLFYEEAAGLYAGLDNPVGTVQSLSNKAAALIDAGRFDEADRELNRAEKMMGTGNPFGPLLRNRGVLLFKKEDYSASQAFLEAALKNTDSANLPELAAVHVALGNLMVKTEQWDEAVHHFEAALAADQFASYYQGIADDLAAIGSVYYHKGEAAHAVGYFKRAVKIYALIRNQSKFDPVRTLMQEAARKAGLDLDLTEFFLEKWNKGDTLERPCR